MGDSRSTSTTIGDLCDRGHLHTQTGPFGSQLHSYDYVGSGIPVVPTEAIGRRKLTTEGIPKVSPDKANSLGRHKLREGDILFARRGVRATGKSALVRRKEVGWICGTGAILLRSLDHDVVDPAFLSFLLSADFSVDWLRQHAVGAVMPNLNESVIRQLPVNIPPLPTQKRIAHILGTLDDKIESNRRMNETLEAMARALFRSWFVDFDPVRARVGGGRSGTGISPVSGEPHRQDADATFPDAFEDSPLGPVPKGWAVGSVSEIGLIQNLSVKPNENPETLWEHYSIPAFDASRSPSKDQGHEIKSNKYAVPEGSVLLSKLNPNTPRIWLPDIEDRSVAICSTEFLPFVPRGEATRSFLYEALRSEPVQFDVCSRATGSTGSRQRVKPTDVSSIEIVIPSSGSIAAFTRQVEPIHAKCAELVKQSNTLAALRDALLPKLLSGELPVAGVEKQADAAV